MAPERAPSVARFIVAGAVAMGVGLVVSHLWITAELSQLGVERQQRRGVVTLGALTELAQRTGGDGEKLRAAAAAWQEGSPVDSLRVVRFTGLSLEASSDADDVGERKAPRRLQKEEKPLYDKGQRLRAAVETNRDEGKSRKDELELEPRPGGGWLVAGPLTEGADVVGLVELKTKAGPAAATPKLTVALGLGLAAVMVVALAAALFLKRSRWLVVALGTLAMSLAVLAHARYATGVFEAERTASDELISQAARAQAQRLVDLSARQGLEGSAPVPGAWDRDAFRHPRGALTPDGLVAPRGEGPWVSGRAVALLSVLTLGLFWLIGLGGAHWFARTAYENRVAYAYITPAMVGMLALVFFPFFYGIVLSFTDANLYNTNRSLGDIWVGLRNYTDILFDFHVTTRAADGGLLVNYANFYWTLLFTIIWTITNVTVGVTVGLSLALALNLKNLALRPVYRVLLILPWAVPNYITALIWKGMFHRQFGVINHLLVLLGGQARSWFDEPVSSFTTALLTNGWLSFPFMMVVSMGALQSIPDELYEAAEVDGASLWQQFRAITLPALRPALVPAVILSVVWTFNMFNIIYLVTGGEPGGATEILVTQAFKHAFERYRYGYAAAYSTVIFLILLVYGVFQNRVSRATEA